MKLLIALAIIVVMLWIVSIIRSAHAEDYWSNCEDGYQFCARRPFHRDCAIWTKWKEPLFLNGTVCPLPRKDPRK